MTGISDWMDDDTQIYLDYGKTGHPILFTALFKKYAMRLKSMLVYMGSLNEMETEDIIQKAFIKVIEKRKDFRPQAKFSTWLYRVVYNTALSYIRDRHTAEQINDKTMISSEHTPLQRAMKNELGHEVEKAMRKLIPRQREALVFREFTGNSYQEIGSIMGISKSAVESLIYHARQNLKKHMQVSDYAKS
jgi:RNA polymerase sigma-70 factor (ECF subfamily)